MAFGRRCSYRRSSLDLADKTFGRTLAIGRDSRLKRRGPTRSNHHIDLPPVKVGTDTRQFVLFSQRFSADDIMNCPV